MDKRWKSSLRTSRIKSCDPFLIHLLRVGQVTPKIKAVLAHEPHSQHWNHVCIHFSIFTMLTKWRFVLHFVDRCSAPGLQSLGHYTPGGFTVRAYKG